jgi:hypothetical protein
MADAVMQTMSQENGASKRLRLVGASQGLGKSRDRHSSDTNREMMRKCPLESGRNVRMRTVGVDLTVIVDARSLQESPTKNHQPGTPTIAIVGAIDP